MNKIYKLVWNAAMGCWSVASELARKGKTNRGTRRLIIASGLMVVSGTTLAECPPGDNLSATGKISCVYRDNDVKNISIGNDGKIKGNVNLSGKESTLQNKGNVYGHVSVNGSKVATLINDGILDSEKDKIVYATAIQTFYVSGADSSSFINNGTVNKGVGVFSSHDARLINNGIMNAEKTRLLQKSRGNMRNLPSLWKIMEP